MAPSRARSADASGERRLARPVRTLAAAGMAIGLVAGVTACTDTAAQDPTTTVETSPADPGASTTTVTTEAVPGPLSDQTPPASTFGIEFHDNQLWVVDFYLGEVLVVDPDSGTIIRRLKAEDNIADEVDNISVDQDGKLYWVGYNDGAVGQVIVSSNVGQVFAKVDAGLCGVAVSPDGKTLYVGGSMTGPAPLYALDPLTRDQKEIVPSLEMRAFAVADDGMIYGPRWGSTEPGATPGALIQIDPTTGARSEIASGLDGPIAAEVASDGTRLFVLSQANGKAPTLQSVDLTTHEVTTLPAPATPLVANLAAAPDGRIFVSSYNTSDISIIGKDGNVRTLAIGQR